jgi:hypothetical protein
MLSKEFINEAGEPPNPSRRGFLKGLAGVAATAATPGGLGKLATAAAPAATTAPAAASALGPLFNAAMSFGLDKGWLGHAYSGDVDPEDYELDPERTKPQGTEGEMPWGEAYELRKTPGGKEYIATSGPYGDSAVFTYYKDGEIRNIEIAWDRDGYGEVWSSDDEADMNAYYDFSDNENLTADNEGQMMDVVINGGNVPAPSAEVQPTSTPAPAQTGTTPGDLARLAGLGKKAIDTLTKTDKPDEPAQNTSMYPTTDTPKELPAPTAPDILEPELEPTKQKVPAQKKK